MLELVTVVKNLPGNIKVLVIQTPRREARALGGLWNTAITVYSNRLSPMLPARHLRMQTASL
ncbi:hypothetical protein MCOR03_010220 [Pyricularia oryzae]|uniref:Uncharacterized protein n=1 Tax=Pyricularia grisea TaxID=148305 RepID=A0ABQ8NN90_PYRGI|nr:hypothetical protein MCOR33_005206 [Pyricularia grisea]KAI6339780.1 hypothetical protein MCOR28_007054 [Pyricularia oryzae]KAI6407851.1 hypothetical protein MCOR24_007448 [Pyricularia oryzae]KAI6423060.1 hypothetical protein MCOR21_008375 [Pyricularia oryzae]KAI6430410.1 hypothetical protein MCOR22_010135 [Pyricularia oryzae]